MKENQKEFRRKRKDNHTGNKGQISSAFQEAREDMNRMIGETMRDNVGLKK